MCLTVIVKLLLLVGSATQKVECIVLWKEEIAEVKLPSEGTCCCIENIGKYFVNRFLMRLYFESIFEYEEEEDYFSQ